MQKGMLWFSNDMNKSASERIMGGVNYYIKKYERVPDLCLVHPSMLDGQRGIELKVGTSKITVRPYRPVLPGHIWIGIEDKS